MKTTTLQPVQRIVSVDAYRGFVMFLMMAEVLSFGRISKALPDSSFWSFLSLQQSHIPWVGCTLHDLIQPSFSFLVGIALPYSIASRATKGQSTTNMWYHTIRRSLILIFLGVFLRSMHKEQTNFTFEDTLSQIGLGYPILFALGFKSERTQWISLAVILVGYWLFFVLYPIAGPDFNWAEAGVAADWEHHLSGFAAHWNKNANAAWAFDRWFMNLFPRPDVFRYNGGGYSTLSFIPTLGTMLLGLIAGQWLRNSTSSTGFLRKLFTTAGILFAIAIFLNVTGLCPIVKRIWTPSWTLFSGAWCFVLLALFYFVVDIKQNQSWFRWLIVIGTNSIAAYVLSHTLTDLIDQSFRINISPNYDQILSAPYATLVSGTVILVVLWLILDWMYKKKLFIKI